MLNDAYKQEMDRLTLDEDFRQRLVSAMTQENPRSQKKWRSFRIVCVAAAVCAALVGSALALSPTLRDIILTSLDFRAAYATELFVGIEDLGIEIDAQSALTDGRVVRLYFTVQDPTGVFFLEDTDNNIFVEPITQDGEGSNGGTGLELVSYAPETQTGLYVFSRGLYPDNTNPIVAAKFTMSYFTPGQRYAGATFFGPADGNCDLPLETLNCTHEGDAIVLCPGQTPCDINADEVAISSMGFGEDGYYHVRVTQKPEVVSIHSDCPFDVNYWMVNPDDPNGPFDDFTLSDRDTVAVPVPGGWDIRLLSLTVDRKELLQVLSVEADYSVSGGRQEGNWNWTVPVEQVEARTIEPAETLILSRTKDSPPPSGRNDEAQVAAVSVSPLSVAVDFATPEGHKYPGHISGSETACAVTLADGTVLEPVYYSETWGSRKGWVMWEFPEAIDPAQVVSVSLNGNEIPF